MLLAIVCNPVWTLQLATMCSTFCMQHLRAPPRPVWTGPKVLMKGPPLDFCSFCAVRSFRLGRIWVDVFSCPQQFLAFCSPWWPDLGSVLHSKVHREGRFPWSLVWNIRIRHPKDVYMKRSFIGHNTAWFSLFSPLFVFYVLCPCARSLAAVSLATVTEISLCTAEPSSFWDLFQPSQQQVQSFCFICASKMLHNREF